MDDTVVISYKGYDIIVDKENENILDGFAWNVKQGNDIKDSQVYFRHHVLSKGVRTTYYLHREVMDVLPYTQDNCIVDHIDGNTLNNCKSNLRITTIKNNSRNSGKGKNNVSGYMGVSRAKNRRKYASWICVDYKNVFLGTYMDKVKAAHAYDIASIKYFGEYARLNFPDFPYDTCDINALLYEPRRIRKSNTTGEIYISIDNESKKYAVSYFETNTGGVKQRKKKRFVDFNEAVVFRNEMHKEDKYG